MARILNAKMEMFCNEYVIDFNGTQAATRAGYSKKTARTIAAKLLTIVDIQNYISELKKELADKNLWTREKSVEVLSDIASNAEKDSDIIAAVKQLNLMHGFNEPEKHDHTSSDGSMSPQNKQRTREEIEKSIRDAGFDPKKVALDE